ncbi:unnamed protein product [Prorocentrum cordatum]|uniref:RNA helicase n=1 Tax=Prorocentrum cordatum TaxID=2364126 RepID=A0ABN9XJD7_9DINO|nr:unnamed protein product [Polarella glacialis]
MGNLPGLPLLDAEKITWKIHDRIMAPPFQQWLLTATPLDRQKLQAVLQGRFTHFKRKQKINLVPFLSAQGFSLTDEDEDEDGKGRRRRRDRGKGDGRRERSRSRRKGKGRDRDRDRDRRRDRDDDDKGKGKRSRKGKRDRRGRDGDRGDWQGPMIDGATGANTIEVKWKPPGWKEGDEKKEGEEEEDEDDDEESEDEEEDSRRRRRGRVERGRVHAHDVDQRGDERRKHATEGVVGSRLRSRRYHHHQTVRRHQRNQGLQPSRA